MIVKKKKNLAFLRSCQIALTNHNNETFQFTQGQDNGVRAGDTEQLVYAEMQGERYGSVQEDRKNGTREIHFAGGNWQQGS